MNKRDFLFTALALASFGAQAGLPEPNGDEVKYTHQEEKSYTAEGWKQIEIDTVTYDIQVNRTPQPQLNVQILRTYSSKDRLRHLVTVDEEAFSLESEPERRRWFASSKPEHEKGLVILNVPQGFNGDVLLHSVSGDVEAYRLSQDLSVATVSGKTQGYRLESPTVTLDSTSGDFAIGFEGPSCQKLSASSTSGDLELTSDGDVALDIETRGDIECEDCKVKKSFTQKRVVQSSGSSQCQVRFSSVSGDFQQ